MVRGSTLLLKITVILMGIPVLGLCLLGLPSFSIEASESYPAYWVYPVIAGMYASAIPFFVALYQAFRLLGYIEKNEAFSELSARSLKTIQSCAITISLVYVGILPFLALIAQEDDAPGLTALGLGIMLASMVIAALAAVLRAAVQQTMARKSENDLTV
nr:DUF2975 domain-containing protein [Paenibacillus phyllosphaerae]